MGSPRRQLLLRRRAVSEEEGPGDLGQPQRRRARVRAEKARCRGLEPARGGPGNRALAALPPPPRARRERRGGVRTGWAPGATGVAPLLSAAPPKAGPMTLTSKRLPETSTV